MLSWHIILFSLGCGILYYGAEILVKGSSRLALTIGIRPLIVGLTIVAMGTSAPELVVSFLATIKKTESIALGNIIGSNVANIGLVVGLAAVIRPIKVKVNTIRKEMPFLIGTTFIFYLLSLDGMLNFIDGLVLFGLFVVFLSYMFRLASKDRGGERKIKNEIKDDVRESKSIIKNIVLTIAGLGLLVSGSWFIVKSAVIIAKTFGVSEIIIGITLVALGTSLPELAVSVVGAFRGQMDLAIGNAVGSNLFNMLFVVSLVTLVYPIPVEAGLLHYEYFFMMGILVVFLPMMRTGFVLNRIEGGILLASYAVFIYFMF